MFVYDVRGWSSAQEMFFFPSFCEGVLVLHIPSSILRYVNYYQIQTHFQNKPSAYNVWVTYNLAENLEWIFGVIVAKIKLFVQLNKMTANFSCVEYKSSVYKHGQSICILTVEKEYACNFSSCKGPLQVIISPLGIYCRQKWSNSRVRPVGTRSKSIIKYQKAAVIVDLWDCSINEHLDKIWQWKLS